MFEWYITDVTLKTEEVQLECDNWLSYLQYRILRSAKNYNGATISSVISDVFNTLNTTKEMPISLWLNDCDTTIIKDFEVWTSFYDILKYCREAEPKLVVRVISEWAYNFLECSKTWWKVLDGVWEYDARNTRGTNIVDWKWKDSMDDFYSFIQNAWWSINDEEFEERTNLIFEKYEDEWALSLPSWIAIPSLTVSRDTDWWDFNIWDRKNIRLLTGYEWLPLEYLWLIQGRKVSINANGWIKAEIKISEDYKSDTNILDLVLQNLRGRKNWWGGWDMSDYYTKSETQSLVSTAVSGKADVNHTHLVSQITDFAQAVADFITSSELATVLSGYSQTWHTHNISDVNWLLNELSGKSNTGHTHTVSDITDFATAVAQAISWKANSEDVYTKAQTYSKTEVDNLLGDKADSSDVYTKTETDNLLGDKADSDDVYTKSETYSKSEVDGLIPDVNDSTITIQVNNTTIKSITLNQANWETINIPVPTNTSDLNNDSWFITKAVSDLTNYYTKSETYTKTEVDGMISNFWWFEVVATLPTTNIKTNVIYLKWPIGTGVDRYEEYIYYSNTWTLIGETSVDLTNYIDKNTAFITINGVAYKFGDSLTTPNTTYDTMTQQEATAGTGTTARVITPKVLVDTITDMISWKADAVHSHAISDVTGLQSALDNKASSVHTHAISDITGLQSALDGKAGTGDIKNSTITFKINSTTFTNNTFTLNQSSNKTIDLPITKSTVGLWNVDNTSDTDKPISTATQQALNLKADKTQIKCFVITESMVTVTTTDEYWVSPYNTSYKYTNITINANAGVEWVEWALYVFVINSTMVVASAYRNVRVRIWTGTYIPLMNSGNSILAWSSYFTKARMDIYCYKTTNQSGGALHMNNDTSYSAMSVAEWQTGTATSGRVVRADYLKQIIEYHANNLIWKGTITLVYDDETLATFWVNDTANKTIVIPTGSSGSDVTEWFVRTMIYAGTGDYDNMFRAQSGLYKVLNALDEDDNLWLTEWEVWEDIVSNQTSMSMISHSYSAMVCVASSKVAMDEILASNNATKEISECWNSIVIVAESDLASELYLSSATGISNLFTYQTAQDAFLSDPNKKTEIVNQYIMTIVNNNTLLSNLYTDSVVATAITNSQDAMNAIASSSTKLWIVDDSSTIMTAIATNSTALWNMSDSDFSTYILENSTYLTTTTSSTAWQNRINSMDADDLLPAIFYWTGLSWYSTFADLAANDWAINIVQSNTNAMLIINCNDEAFSYLERQPGTNTIAYFPLEDNVTDKVQGLTLTTSGTQDTLGRIFTATTTFSDRTKTSPTKFISVFIKINSGLNGTNCCTQLFDLGTTPCCYVTSHSSSQFRNSVHYRNTSD